MIILIKEHSDQKIIQQILFEQGYVWKAIIPNIIIEPRFNEFIYYIIYENEKELVYVIDAYLTTLKHYINKMNSGKLPIDSKTFLREEKLKRILYV